MDGFVNFISKITVGLGIVLVFSSYINLYEWRGSQNYKPQLNQTYDNSFADEIEGEKKEHKEIQIKADKKYIDRDDYETGMMEIEIPKIEVRAKVINGTSRENLKLGPGLYDISTLELDKRSNLCIAGHRTTYGAWFRNVDKLSKGDKVNIYFLGYKYVYGIEKVFIVEKNDWSVTKPLDYSGITLTACHPLRSAKQRIVVRGKLECSKILNK